MTMSLAPQCLTYNSCITHYLYSYLYVLDNVATINVATINVARLLLTLIFTFYCCKSFMYSTIYICHDIMLLFIIVPVIVYLE